METFKESAMRVRQGDVKPTAKIMVTQHIEKGNFKRTLDLLKHMGKKVKVDKSTEGTSKAIWTIEGTMNESAMDQKMFDSLKKGDKLSVSFGSGIRKDNKVTLLVKSKSKSAKYNLEKINCVNVNNPGGMKYTIYNRQGKFSLAQGDMATSAPDFVKESMQFDEKRDAGKSATGYDIYHKTYSSAMQHAYAHAKKKHGVTVSSDEIDNKVATGPSKPSSGKTVSHVLGTDKKKKLHVQVYNTGKSYELNMYVESVEEASILKTVHKNVTNKKSAEKDRKNAVKTMKDIRKGKYAGVKMANEGQKPVSQMTPAEKAADAKRRKEYNAYQKSKRNESVELDEAIDFFKVSKELLDYAKKHGGPDKREFEKAAAYVREIGKNSAVSVQDKAGKGLNMLFKNADTDVRDRMQMILTKGGFKVKGGYVMRESFEENAVELDEAIGKLGPNASREDKIKHTMKIMKMYPANKGKSEKQLRKGATDYIDQFTNKNKRDDAYIAKMKAKKESVEEATDLLREGLEEKAVSKSQQKFMGMVRATQKGDMKDPSPEVAKAAKSMKNKDVKDFASTKHKGLPEMKTFESIRRGVEIAKKSGGAMTPAVKKIDRIKKNLSNNPRIQKQLRKANEEN